MVKGANEAGIKQIICIGTDHSDSLVAKDFAKKHKNVFWTYGVHPENSTEDKKLAIDRSKLNFKKGSASRPVAIGEVGLDYHSEGFNREEQIKLFEQMLQLASDNDLTLSFHVRNAFEDFFAVINNFPKVRGVVHSFTDSKKTLKRIFHKDKLSIFIISIFYHFCFYIFKSCFLIAFLSYRIGIKNI